MIPWRICLKSPYFRTEVAPGEPKACHPGDEMYCHVSQAALGPGLNGKSERVVLRVETGGKDVVLGTLSTGKCDQMALDLIFDREFKLSHTGTSCSVYFCGYKTEKGEAEDFDSEMEGEDEEESEEEEGPDAVATKANGDAKRKEGGKATSEAVKKLTKSPVKPQLVDDEAEEGDDSEDEDEFTPMSSTVMDFGSDDSDEEDDSEFEDDEDDDSDVEDSDELDEDDSDEDDESEDEELATPEVGKKRHLKETDANIPAIGKKARVDTPAKPGLASAPGKKSEKVAAKAASAAPTSTPAKGTPSTPGGKKSKDGKTGKEAKKEKKSPQKSPGKETLMKTPKTTAAKAEATPTSGSGKKVLGTHKCDSCSRTFVTEAAVSQHMSAKHGTPASGK